MPRRALEDALLQNEVGNELEKTGSTRGGHKKHPEYQGGRFQNSRAGQLRATVEGQRAPGAMLWGWGSDYQRLTRETQPGRGVGAALV